MRSTDKALRKYDYVYNTYILYMVLHWRRQFNLYFSCNRFVMDCEQTAFQTVCVVHCFLGSFYMSRLGGEGGNAFSCDVLSSV